MRVPLYFQYVYNVIYFSQFTFKRKNVTFLPSISNSQSIFNIQYIRVTPLSEYMVPRKYVRM